MLLDHCLLGVLGGGRGGGQVGAMVKMEKHIGSPSCIPRSELGLAGLAECCWMMI